MTPKEAIDFINNEVQIDVRFCTEEKVDKTIGVFNLATKALEKQIPKKPINKTKCDNTTAKLYKNCNIVVCPLCNGRLKLKSKGKHCDKCGQALDWSGDK